MNSRLRSTLGGITRPVVALVLALCALASFTIAAWGVDWRIGLAAAGVALFVAEWRISE